MKNYKILATAFLAAAMAAGAAPLPAQVTSSTIVVKNQAPSHTSKTSWMSAEVIHADANSMIVRERQNGMMIHTFTYASTLQAHMQKVADKGGYQFGDKVKVLYQSGKTVALKIHGKPSKLL